MSIVFTGPARLAAEVSRSMRKTFNRLGVISVPAGGRVKLVRDERLDKYDKYLENTQYDNLKAWEKSIAPTGEYVPVRERKPRIIYPFAKVLSDRIASKLVGTSTFPSFKVEDDPDTEEFIRAIVTASKLNSRILEPMRKMSVTGSVFVRFFITEGVIKIEHYNAKHCYPEFLGNGELAIVVVRFVFDDKNDIDETTGAPKKKWFRLDVGQFADVLYDNPDYRENIEPVFTPVSTATHNLGFVQGEWFKTGEKVDSPDGPSLISGITDFIDELNYSISQSSQAVSYNQDPQLAFKGMDEEDVNTFIRSATKGWNLGKEGEATFLESTLVGVERSNELRDKVRLAIQDIARVLLLDPEKMVAHAQSAKAMEVLHGPFLELINELRPMVEEGLTRLTQKMALTTLILNQMGAPVPVSIPPGYKPQSMNVSVIWPPVFPMTIEDLKARVAWVLSATNGNLVSRETGLKIIAKDFGVEDIEEELAKISAQPQFNPFGAF